MSNPEIHTIRDQYAAGQWKQFIRSIEIQGLRGWTGQTIAFPFPIVTITGENGSGKSTILKAIASAYEGPTKDLTYFPSDFFQDTQWDRIAGVKLIFNIQQGDNIINYKITKATERWNFQDNKPRRNVFFQDISRTLPLDATAGYAKIAKLAKSEVASQNLDAENLSKLSFVMGRNYAGARFVTTDVSTRDVGLLRRDTGEISQYHQGAGEDATLDLFKMLQGIPPQSLLIIDEVEASLHPKAQRRLIRQLIELCRVKKIQVITSTHSPYILEELPPEARILIVPGPQGNNVIYNSTTEFALSRIDDPVHPEMSIFVEDRDAETLLKEIILASQNGGEIISRIDFCPAGPANVIQTLGNLGHTKKLPLKKVLAVVDGDKEATLGCIKLPGDIAPERLVYSQLKAGNWYDLPERFGIGAGSLITILNDVILNPDHHEWNNLVGDKIRKGGNAVWETLCNTWCKKCLSTEAASAIMDPIHAILVRRE